MFTLNPRLIFERFGVKDVDPELIEFWAMFVIRFQNAPQKGAFLKESLRRALEERKP